MEAKQEKLWKVTALGKTQGLVTLMNHPEPDRQNVRILQIVNIYRLALSLTLLLSFFISPVTTRLGNHDPDLFLVVTGAYCLLALIAALLVAPDSRNRQRHILLVAMLLTDVLALSLIIYSSGGMISGLGVLLVISVAAGTLLVPGRIALLLPATASISVIYSEVYLTLTLEDPPQQFIQAGLLGALMFVASLYLQYLGERMRRSTQLAAEQATDIENLAQLNHLIVQRLQTGILLLDSDNRIISSNHAARELLGIEKPENQRLPSPMHTLLEQWQLMQLQPTSPVVIGSPGRNLQVNFARLHPSSPQRTLVFLDDHGRIIQRARQMKLASLGRLTASIAHEISNPLAALTHAGQLLHESPGVPEGERRLTEIVVNQGQRINGIIQDVLDLSRQDAQPAIDIRLKPWLENFARHYCASQEHAPQISIDVDPEDTRINFVPSHLTQILNNLVENGLRYSLSATGVARISLRGGMPAGSLRDEALLDVIDEGPGVDPEVEENLFEPFHTTEASGTGLGLYISRQLCEANQARLEYRRTDDGQSCFTLYFGHPDRSIR